MIGVVSAIGGCLLGWLVLILFNQSGGFDLTFAQGMGDITALMGDAIFANINFISIARFGVVVAGMAALASLFPAWQASRKEPAETLHYV